MQTAKLARMANQIAANLGHGPDAELAAAAVADHLRRFWNSSMRGALVEAHAQGSVSLSPVAARAVDVLAAARPAS